MSKDCIIILKKITFKQDFKKTAKKLLPNDFRTF